VSGLRLHFLQRCLKKIVYRHAVLIDAVKIPLEPSSTAWQPLTVRQSYRILNEALCCPLNIAAVDSYVNDRQSNIAGERVKIRPRLRKFVKVFKVDPIGSDEDRALFLRRQFDQVFDPLRSLSKTVDGGRKSKEEPSTLTSQRRFVESFIQRNLSHGGTVGQGRSSKDECGTAKRHKRCDQRLPFLDGEALRVKNRRGENESGKHKQTEGEKIPSLAHGFPRAIIQLRVAA